MAPSDEQSPGRALLVALSAMAGVALLVGIAVGGVVLGVVKLAGVDSSSTEAEEAPESLFMPKYQPTKAVEDDLGLPGIPASPTPTVESPSEDPSPRADRITLFVAPQAVSPGSRINFNGVYLDGEGVALQIQRRENGVWVDFPVTASVSGGSFSTWITTSRTGKTFFRVFDESTNRTSNVVTVQIG